MTKSSVPITQQQVITLPEINQPKLDNSIAETTRATGQAFTQVGANIAFLAKKNYDLNAEAKMRDDINGLENQYLGDPDGLATALEKYRGDLATSQPDPITGAAMEHRFSVLATPSFNRVQEAKRVVLSNQVETASLSGIQKAENQIYNLAPELFSSNPKRVADANAAINQSKMDIAGILDGVGADGKPLFTPEQKFTRAQKINDNLSITAAKTWLSSQPNQITAYRKWLNNEVQISSVDLDGNPVKVNARESLDPLTREKVDVDLMKNLKDNLYIKKQFLKEQQDAADSFRSTQTVQNAINGYVTLDPNSKDSQKAIDSYWKQRQTSLINSGKKQQEVLDDSLVLVQKTGIMPTAIKSVLNANITNGNVEQRAAYSKYIADAADINPRVVGDLDKSTQAMAFSVAKNLRAGLSKEDAVNWALNDISEAKKEDNKVRETSFDKFYKDQKIDKKIVSDLKDEPGFDLLSKNPQVPDALLTEYKRLAKGYYVNEKVDAQTANQMAEKTMRSQWGVTEIGGKRYMKYAPEVIYGNKDGWIQKQLETEYQAPAKDLSLEVDYSTAQTPRPSYFVFKKNEFGGVEPVLDENNLPKRFAPNYDKTRQAQIESDLTQAKSERAAKALEQRIRELVPLGR